MDKVSKKLKELQNMAKNYSVDKNAMVNAAIEQYAFQLEVIDRMKEELSNDELMTSKEYVKGRENVYANPIIKELPKHSDAANKTAATIINLITTYGTPPAPENRLTELMKK